MRKRITLDPATFPPNVLARIEHEAAALAVPLAVYIRLVMVQYIATLEPIDPAKKETPS